MKKLLCLLLLILPLLSQAQAPFPMPLSWPDSNGHMIMPESTFLQADLKDSALIPAAMVYLKNTLAQLSGINNGLKLKLFRTSPMGTHISFTQLYKDYPVYASDVSIHIEGHNKVAIVTYKITFTYAWPENIVIPDADTKTIEAGINNYDYYEVRKTWYPTEGTAVPAYIVEFGKNGGDRHWEKVLDLNYHPLYQIDKTRKYGNGKDSLVTMYVFYPDPLTSAQVPYGFPYINANDSAIPALDAQRQPKQELANYVNGAFWLENKYYKESDLTPPNNPLTSSLTNKFNLSRHDTGFEGVNSYFHINNYQKHIKDLNLFNLGEKQVYVDPHGLSGDDNSRFDPGRRTCTLNFGVGGIQDAEDADVIVHEYTHFLSYDAAGDAMYGLERSSMEEGFCDYMAASYSRNISMYHWSHIYNWDGNVPPDWLGRSADSKKVYPNDFASDYSKIHANGEIWISAIMDIYDAIGRDRADLLMLNSLYYMVINLGMQDGAKAYVHVNEVYYHGQNSDTIVAIFKKHGLLPSNYTSGIIQATDIAKDIAIDSRYFSTDNKIIIDINTPISGTANLYDIQGRLLCSEAINGQKHINYHTSEKLAAGVYILNLNTAEGQMTRKLIK